MLETDCGPYGLVKNRCHSGTLALLEGALKRMSVPGSKKDKSATEKSPGECPAVAGGGQAAEDDNATVWANHKLRQELGGPEGPEPTRYGDWERKGRCIDF